MSIFCSIPTGNVCYCIFVSIFISLLWFGASAVSLWQRAKVCVINLQRMQFDIWPRLFKIHISQAVSSVRGTRPSNCTWKIMLYHHHGSSPKLNDSSHDQLLIHCPHQFMSSTVHVLISSHPFPWGALHYERVWYTNVLYSSCMLSEALEWVHCQNTVFPPLFHCDAQTRSAVYIRSCF